ncbi:MAG: transposase family protein [Nostoc sp.]|uniref:transposase family protein n=1 Tax=Nostoc sp. TaxID=1180 RepID=UPI002FF6A1CA
MDYQEQKNTTQGRKRCILLKINLLFYQMENISLVDVIVGKLEETSDINLFRASRDKFDPEQKFLADKAYKGDNAIVTPHKKTKNQEIPELQKQENKELSSRRIGVEHLIGRIKIFKVARDRFRLAYNKYNRIIMSVCGLVRLRMNQVFILSLNSSRKLFKIKYI